MVKEICDSYKFENEARNNYRYITFEYSLNTKDREIIKEIEQLLSDLQDRCDNCIHYKSGGYFCGYESHYCDIHGNIEWFEHPHYDGDGSKCKDYCRKTKEKEDE